MGGVKTCANQLAFGASWPFSNVATESGTIAGGRPISHIAVWEGGIIVSGVEAISCQLAYRGVVLSTAAGYKADVSLLVDSIR